MEAAIPKPDGEYATTAPPRPFRIVHSLADRLWEHGASTLNDAELLAILIRGGTGAANALDLAHALLHQCGGNLLDLTRKSAFELADAAGMTRYRVEIILAAVELGRRRMSATPEVRPCITSSLQAYELLRAVLADLNHEEFWLLHLDRGKRLLGRDRVSMGGMHGTVADPKVIFKRALERRASSLVLAHNHPSGQLMPSAEDLHLTKKLVEGSRLLDIGVDDHVIVAQTGYYSFADHGMLLG